MPLPSNTPQPILDTMDAYREGRRTRIETRDHIDNLGKDSAEIRRFREAHMQFLDYDDDVSWNW